MSWNSARSRRRILEHLETAPEFDANLSLAKRQRMLVEARAKGLMDRMSSRKAFLVEGAHLYGQLLDFDQVVGESDGRETESSHRNLLRFLNMHYRLWDAIVEGDDADRVDYHGARMHGIVTVPENQPHNQIRRAVALAAKLGEATRRVASAYGFPARIRFGIDQGMCVALTTGREHERDTLFLGSPANYAAKLAAGGDEEGIFLTQTAQSTVGATNLRTKGLMGENVLARDFIDEAIRTNPFDRIDRAADRIIAEAENEPTFIFHRVTPPLLAVKFRELYPSNSIRMEMASLFADIDGFTAFVDAAIRSGGEAVKRAARGIHVIREELNDVLKDDFGGKRVRFIGDCIQGVIAEGERRDDGSATVREAVYCAAAMKSSFELCQEIVGGLAEIDLAIGIEHGPVPLTRLGQRGDESVRCASGRAVVVAGRVQGSIDGGGMKLGPAAAGLADATTRRHFANASSIIDYDSAVDLLGAVESPAISIIREDRTARPYSEKV